MFDPRTDLISLFTSSRLEANSRYSSTSVFVKIIKEEVDNAEIEPNDYGKKYVGIMWLHPPRAYNKSMDVGFSTTGHDAVIDCRLIIPRNDKWLKNTHETYINTVLHLFEIRVRANADATAGKSWDTAEVTAMPVSDNPDQPNMCYRVLETVFTKAN